MKTEIDASEKALMIFVVELPHTNSVCFQLIDLSNLRVNIKIVNILYKPIKLILRLNFRYHSLRWNILIHTYTCLFYIIFKSTRQNAYSVRIYTALKYFTRFWTLKILQGKKRKNGRNQYWKLIQSKYH